MIMLLQSWFGLLRPRCCRLSTPMRRRRSHKPSGTRLSFEHLEDRTVPSTFTVLNLVDSGAGSLRQAVHAANIAPGADAIAFGPGLHGTLTLTSGELTVSDDLTV